MPSTLKRPLTGWLRGGVDEGVVLRKEGDTSTAATQFRYGDVVKYDANSKIVGYLQITGNQTSANPSAKGLGLVLKDSRDQAVPTTQINDVPVIPFADQTIWLMPVYSATPANTLQSAQKCGLNYRIVCRGGIYAVDLDNAVTDLYPADCTASAACVTIVDLVQDTPETESNVFVWVKWAAIRRSNG